MSETIALPTTGLPPHIQPGLVIADKYRLEQEIGRGSMGTVYRAVHVTLGQRVAIKLISGAHSQSAEARQRFSIEAKAAAKLRSRHVVQVIDDGETPQGNPYIVLEFLDGETLEQRVQREHDVPLRDAVRVVKHAGRALARAHAQGIVHRDL
jgi:serine/threonine-protein kinase